MKKSAFVVICVFLSSVSGHAVSDVPGLVGIKLDTVWRVKRDSGYFIASAIQTPTAHTEAEALYYVPSTAQDIDGKPLSSLLPLPQLGMPGDAQQMPSGFLWSKLEAYPGIAEVSGLYYKVSGKPVSGYAYRRSSGEHLVSVSGGGVTVKSNENAGGAVWEWWWQGKQFINDYDYGRQLQMAVYTDDGKALEEAGEKYGTPDVPPYARHESPTLYVKNSAVNHQSSRAVPIEWSPEGHSGGKSNAVIYANAKVGKEMTLNWIGRDRVDRQWPVVLYESVYEGPSFPAVSIEAPTAYLNAEFTTYYKYDPRTDSLTSMAVDHSKVDVSAGGVASVIIASGPGPDAIAMGIYMNDPNAGIVVYDNSGPSQGKFGSSFSKWGVVYRSGLPSVWKFRTWIATDRVQNVRKYFKQLYSWGVESRDKPQAQH